MIHPVCLQSLCSGATEELPAGNFLDISQSGFQVDDRLAFGCMWSALSQHGDRPLIDQPL